MRLPLSNLRQSIYYKGNIFSLLNTHEVFNIDGQSNLHSQKQNKKQEDRRQKTNCPLSQKQGSTVFRTGQTDKNERDSCPSREGWTDSGHSTFVHDSSLNYEYLENGGKAEQQIPRVSSKDGTPLNVYFTLSSAAGGGQITPVLSIHSQISHILRSNKQLEKRLRH